ncbi:MAK10-like protein [Tanacetum coccineum]
MDSLDLDVANRERTRLCLFKFSLRDQASNWLERLPAGSISTCEDLTTRFLAQLFPPGRTAKLRNNIPITLDRLLIELENQVQCLMEAHLASKKPIQVNKITSSCEICSGSHDTQYCMKNPEQAFVEYASSSTDKAGGLVSNFMASQDARLSKFEADFKQQSEMTKKVNTILKAITDQMEGALPSDTVKNPKLNVNSTSLVLYSRSYPTVDPQCSPHPPNSINTVKKCSKEINHSQKDQLKPVMEIKTRLPEEPEQTLEDEFKDLHLNMPVLEVLAHAPMYNVILDKYVESLELGKNRSAFILGEVPKNMEDPRLFTLPCRLGDSEPFDTLADLWACVNIIPLYLFKKLNIGLLEETDHVFRLADGTKSYPIGIVRDVEVHIGRLKLLTDFYVIDMKKDPKTPLLVGRGFLATANAFIDCRKAKIAVDIDKKKSLKILEFSLDDSWRMSNQIRMFSSPLVTKPGEY